MIKRLLISLVILTSLVLPQISTAAIVEVIGGNLTANINPRYPQPGQEVAVRLTGFGFNLDNSHITWLIDGREVRAGLGEKSHNLRVGDIGSQTRVGVLVEPPGRTEIVVTILFRPSEIDLLIDADTSVPLNYSGAALPTAGSNIRITAIPHLINSRGERLAAANLDWQWQIDGRDQPDLSGLGQSFIDLTNIRSGTKIITKATDQTSGLVARDEIIIRLNQPEINLYEVRPLVGPIYSRALFDAWRPTETDFTLKIQPYYFPNQQLNTLSYFWQIDDQLINGPSTRSQSHNFSYQPTGQQTIDLTAGITGPTISTRPIIRSLIINTTP